MLFEPGRATTEGFMGSGAQADRFSHVGRFR